MCRNGERGGVGRAARLMENLPPSHWSREFIWERTVRLREFVRLREELGLEEAHAPPPDPEDEQDRAEIARALADAEKMQEAMWEGTTIDDYLGEAASIEAEHRLVLAGGRV